MKMSRRERRIFNLGKKAGYSEGYAKGYYDGNPFNSLFDAVKTLTVSIDEMLKDPAFIEALKELKEQPDLYDGVLEIEEEGNK